MQIHVYTYFDQGYTLELCLIEPSNTIAINIIHNSPVYI